VLGPWPGDGGVVFLGGRQVRRFRPNSGGRVVFCGIFCPGRRAGAWGWRRGRRGSRRGRRRIFR
jgi:hypothetical protein